MKKLIISLTIFTFLFLPLRGYANIDQVQIRQVILRTAVACAVSIQILNIVDNQYNGSEALFFGTLRVATLALLFVNLVALSAGSNLLFASPSFEQSEDIVADVLISDADCALLQEGQEVSFVGSFAATVAALTILTGFALNFAMVFLASTGAYDIFDLSLFSLLIINLAGVTRSVGEGSPIDEGDDDDGGGGCALAKQGPEQGSHAWLLWGFLALGGLGWGIRRRMKTV